MNLAAGAPLPPLNWIISIAIAPATNGSTTAMASATAKKAPALNKFRNYADRCNCVECAAGWCEYRMSSRIKSKDDKSALRGSSIFRLYCARFYSVFFFLLCYRRMHSRVQTNATEFSFARKKNVFICKCKSEKKIDLNLTTIACDGDKYLRRALAQSHKVW